MSALNPLIQILFALGFETDKPALHFTRKVSGWAGRQETFILDHGGTKFSVEAVHTDGKDVWYSESICEGGQTLPNLAMALAMIEDDRKVAPKTRPLPEWECHTQPPSPPGFPITNEVILLNRGVAVASLAPMGQINIKELGRRIVTALTTVKKP